MSQFRVHRLKAGNRQKQCERLSVWESWCVGGRKRKRRDRKLVVYVHHGDNVSLCAAISHYWFSTFRPPQRCMTPIISPHYRWSLGCWMCLCLSSRITSRQSLGHNELSLCCPPHTGVTQKCLPSTTPPPSWTWPMGFSLHGGGKCLLRMKDEFPRANLDTRVLYPVTWL